MSTTKVDSVLRALDRIKATIEEEMSRLSISPQPILQFFGPPIPPHMALVQAAWDRSRINRLLEIVPEPPEQPTSRARHIGPTSEASKQRLAAELEGKDAPATPPPPSPASATAAAPAKKGGKKGKQAA